MVLFSHKWHLSELYTQTKSIYYNGAKAKFCEQYILRKYPMKNYETLPVPITWTIVLRYSIFISMGFHSFCVRAVLSVFTAFSRRFLCVKERSACVFSRTSAWYCMGWVRGVKNSPPHSQNYLTLFSQWPNGHNCHSSAELLNYIGGTDRYWLSTHYDITITILVLIDTGWVLITTQPLLF